MIKHKIDDTNHKLRLDHFLMTKIPESRSNIQKRIKDGSILVNGLIVKTGYILTINDEITIIEQALEKLNLKPVEMALDIMYEDADILVINKPKGLVVHPANTYYEPTLVHALLAQITDLSGINGIIRPGIVHRIDKDTSGLLLVAKNDFAHKCLAAQLAKHEIKRKYYALVYGRVKNKIGMIDAPIGRHVKNRLKFSVVAGGKPAITHFKVVEVFHNFTLLELSLETGRTHQIRVHLSYIGHPIVGDPLYGPHKVIGKQGQFLHAFALSFNHPTQKEKITITCDLPEYFSQHLATLD